MLALLRCRDRLTQVLNAVAEPRRSEVAAVIAELEHCAEASLKQTLADVVRREEAALREAVARALGEDDAKTPRAVRQWIARVRGR